jgi:uncharacterized Zn ribbon protein
MGGDFMYTITEYNYEGMAEVYCKKCDTSFSIEFSGDDSRKIRDSIKESLLELGWTTNYCPQCSEELIENGDSDEPDNFDTDY